MRLIDADKLIEAINNPTTFEGQLEITLEDFVDLVNKLPIAYNPEKVVEELEEKQEKWKTQLQENDTNFLDHEILKQYVKHYDDAIDIVKRGGVE